MDPISYLFSSRKNEEELETCLIAGVGLFEIRMLILLWMSFTRPDKGGAFLYDTWKCQSYLKNVDELAIVCRFCDTLN